MPARVVIIPGRHPEGRVDRITGDEVTISPARSRRDEKKTPLYAYHTLPAWKENCPFCLGNEEMTTETLVERHNTTHFPWASRGFANMFPPVLLEAEGSAFGASEVIVDTPVHNGCLSGMHEDDVALLFSAIIDRFFSLSGDKRLQWFSVFKNYGKEAGGSQEHPHTQLMIKGVIPKKFRDQYKRAQEYRWNTGRLLCCDEIERHHTLGLIVFKSRFFVVLVPHAAKAPYHMRLYPIEHVSSFPHMLQDSLIRRDFAWALKTMTSLFKRAVQGTESEGQSDPVFNYYIDTAPYNDIKSSIPHWRLDFLGKTTTPAGYEEHSGEFINPTYPEEIAEDLRRLIHAL